MRAPRFSSAAALFLLLALAGLPCARAQGTATDALARGDAAWERRAEGHDGARAAAGPIGEAVAAYAEALTADPRDLEARWKLLRALYFQGEHAAAPEQRLAIYLRGRDLGEEGIAQLEGAIGRPLRKMKPAAAAAALAAPPAARGVVFWTAVHWGLWGRERGKMASARQGVAGTIRDYAQIVIALDPDLEEAGAYRVLGRLHTEAPRIPLFTGWVSRDTAISSLEEASRRIPANLLNRLYLSEALLEFRPARRAEALKLLREVAASTPRPYYVVEEARVVEDARALLARSGG